MTGNQGIPPWTALLAGALWLILTSSLVQGATYYCGPGGRSVYLNGSGTIRTVLEGKGDYGNNLKCNWLLDAGENRRAFVHIVSTNLQFTPSNAICNGYDFLDFREGWEHSGTKLLDWCGKKDLLPTEVITEGRYLNVTFMSDGQNIYSYKGVTFTFTSFGMDECPPKWVSNQEACYSMRKAKTHWSKAQGNCGAAHANLVSIKNSQQEQFLKDYAKNTTQEDNPIFWLSLNDIAKDGGFTWLDGSTSVRVPEFNEKSRDCVRTATDSSWIADYCTDSYNSQFYFICQRRKVGNTTVYSIPQNEKDSGLLPSDIADPTIVMPVMVGVLASLLVIFLVIGGLIYWKKKRARESSSPSTPNTAPMSTVSARGPPETPTAPTLDHPPTYDEAIEESKRTTAAVSDAAI